MRPPPTPRSSTSSDPAAVLPAPSPACRFRATRCRCRSRSGRRGARPRVCPASPAPRPSASAVHADRPLWWPPPWSSTTATLTPNGSRSRPMVACTVALPAAGRAGGQTRARLGLRRRPQPYPQVDAEAPGSWSARPARSRSARSPGRPIGNRKALMIFSSYVLGTGTGTFAGIICG
jgi:hypothetical protein